MFSGVSKGNFGKKWVKNVFRNKMNIFVQFVKFIQSEQCSQFPH